jgi:hypothetical protein
MAYDHETVIRAQYQQLAADRAQALAEYEAGRIKEDDYETMSAANRILEADQKAMALDRIANQYVRSQQQGPQGNPHGLSDDEMDIAKGSHLTPEQYSKNKQKYQAMKSQG